MDRIAYCWGGLRTEAAMENYHRRDRRASRASGPSHSCRELVAGRFASAPGRSAHQRGARRARRGEDSRRRCPSSSGLALSACLPSVDLRGLPLFAGVGVVGAAAGTGGALNPECSFAADTGVVALGLPRFAGEAGP